LPLKSFGEYADKVKDILKLLESKFAFITDYTETADENGEVVSFTYATSKIKQLLTNEGKILEIYVYHKCLKSGLFDDVATGYEINWNGTSVDSEFDVIITKGFEGLLIETKATEKIDQGYYFELSGLAAKFGTNCKAVLIADTVEQRCNDNSSNETQRMRGNMLNIVTIFNPCEIDNIDVTLAKLLNIGGST
jgi:hypothetical protein